MVKTLYWERRNEASRAASPNADRPIHERDRAFELSRRSKPDSTSGPKARDRYGAKSHDLVSFSIDD
jgi:hypothetical protein